MEQTKTKQKISKKERFEQIKNHIRELGFWNLPTQQALAEKFGVSQVTISKDIKKIISSFDPGELDEVFTAFYFTDKKIARELSKIIYQGHDEIKLRAAQIMLQLQKSFTELLESWNKKQKMAENLNVNFKDYSFEIITNQEGNNAKLNGE